MLPPKIRIVAGWLAWSMAAWLSIFAAIFGLQHDLAKDFDWCILPVLAVPIAAFCTVKAVRILCCLPRIGRVIFWMITLPGAVLIVLLIWGQAEVLKYRGDLKMVVFGGILSVLFMLLLGVQIKRTKRAGTPAVRWISDCTIAAIGLVILLGGAFFVFAKIYVPQVGRKAEARWAAIGRPMPEFEKNLRNVDENESLRELTRDLHPFGLVSFYKRPTDSGEPDKIELPEEYTAFSQVVQNSKSDQIDLTVKNLPPYLDRHKEDLDRLYQGVLQRVPPVWGFVPTDGMKMRVPGFLSARKLSQIIYADAIYRFEQGDTKGAITAIAAGLKMTGNLGEQPILVCPMIRSGIEALFAKATARLPEDPDALKRLADEVKKKREHWLTMMQFECWSPLHIVSQFRIEYIMGGNVQLFRISPLPRWLNKYIGQPGLLISGYNQWLAVADQIKIVRNAEFLSATDLGATEMVAIADRFPTYFSCAWSRAWQLYNASFLLREQAELIRWSRTQIQAGKSGVLSERPSVVIPSSKWVITGDAATNSVSMKLTPAPLWTTSQTVVDDSFFLLPLDGSKWWFFTKTKESAY